IQGQFAPVPPGKAIPADLRELSAGRRDSADSNLRTVWFRKTEPSRLAAEWRDLRQIARDRAALPNSIHANRRTGDAKTADASSPHWERASGLRAAGSLRL